MWSFSLEGCIGDIGKSSHLAVYLFYVDIYLHARMWNVVMLILSKINYEKENIQLMLSFGLKANTIWRIYQQGMFLYFFSIMTRLRLLYIISLSRDSTWTGCFTFFFFNHDYFTLHYMYIYVLSKYVGGGVTKISSWRINTSRQRIKQLGIFCWFYFSSMVFPFFLSHSQ